MNSDQTDAEPEGVYQYTRTQNGTIAPVNYSALAKGVELSEAHSAIIESQALNSFGEREAFVYGKPPEEMDRRFERQVQVQREQLDMICAQKESFDTLKQVQRKTNIASIFCSKRKSQWLLS